MVSTVIKAHPFEALDRDILDFWLNLVPGYQRTKWHNDIHERLIEARYNDGIPVPNVTVISGGEQSGKSRLGGAHMFAMHWMSKILWIVGERYDDCRYEFQYLIDAGIATGSLDVKNVSFPQSPGPSRAVFNNGCIVRTLSSSDVTTLASESPDGILMVEAGRQTEAAFRVLLGRSVHHLAWLLVSGTFEQYKGRWFPDLTAQFSGDNELRGKWCRLPSFANPLNYPGGEYDPKILAARKTLSDEEFSERFLGIPRSPMGVVFPEFRRSTHVKLEAEFDRSLPVRLWVDPGYYPSSYAVLFVQLLGPQIRVIDELYLNSMVNEDVVDLALNHETYRNWERVVIDVAATSHAGAQDPAADVWRRKLVSKGIPVVSKYVKVGDGISRTHDKLRFNPIANEPYMIFHPRCENTIIELEEGYRFHTRKEGEIMGDLPIDAHNHSAKALAYGIVDTFGIAEGGKNLTLAPKRFKMGYDVRRR